MYIITLQLALDDLALKNLHCRYCHLICDSSIAKKLDLKSRIIVVRDLSISRIRLYSLCSCLSLPFIISNYITSFCCSNVAGFIYVTEVDTQGFETEFLFWIEACFVVMLAFFSSINISFCGHRKTVTYLGPSAGNLPTKYLIMGTLSWLETWSFFRTKSETVWT